MKMNDRPTLAHPSGAPRPSVTPGLPAGWVPGGEILCISENPPASRRELTPLLEKLGCRVEIVEASVDQAAAPAPEAGYRMVIFDIDQGNGPGFELCQQQRAASVTPIFLLLRGAARGDVLRAYQSGADAHVVCPFEPREFHARLFALLRRQNVFPNQ